MLPKIYVHGSTTVLTHGSQCRVLARSQGADWRTLDTDSGVRGQVARQSTHGASGLVLAAAFSRSGKLFALTTDCKQLLVFTTDTWQRTHEFQVAKKSVVLLFPIDDGSVLVADKFGDVYRYSLSAAADAGAVSEQLADDGAVVAAAAGGAPASGATCGGELVLGHLSTILDAAFLGDGKYLATGDRDEKIRVTRYPQSYDIVSYCLGHTKMVTRLLPLWLATTTARGNGQELLLSGGADGTVRLWDHVTGVQLACFSGAASLPQSPTAGDAAIVSSLHWVPGRQTAIVTFEGERVLVSLRVDTAADGDAGGRRDDSGRAAAAAAAASAGQPSLRFVQTVVLDAVPWCVHAHALGVLVLQARSGRPLLSLEFGPDDLLHEAGQLQQAAGEERELYAWLDAPLRDEWSALSSYVGGSDFYAKLEKMGVDNLPDYLHKKRERLSAAKEKREALLPPQQQATTAGEPGSGGPPAKLCKSDAAA